MVEKIWKFCKEKNLIEENDYIVAGISGGADSVCLLFVLLELQKRISFDIHVVHINHGIREEAVEDANYVKELCAKNKLPFSLVECKVEEYAKRNHLSCEEAGRIVRYNAFYDTLEKNKGNQNGKIAIAHNENDLAETFMFNLFRGSGLKGLSGIQAKRDQIIRPLLCVSRNEIEEFLNSRNIKFVIDRTNLEDDYTRNRIRHHILPEAQKEVPNAIAQIKKAADKIDEAYKLINEMCSLEYDRCVIKKENSLIILKDIFDTLPNAMQGYIAKMAIEEQAKKSKDITSTHVNDLKQLMEKQTGRSLSLPYNIEASRIYEGVLLEYRSDNEKEYFERIITSLDFGKEIILSKDTKVIFSKREITTDDCKNIPTNAYTKWFDYDKIKGSMCVRTRKNGDFFIIDQMGHKKTLKAYFIDAKIPANQRDKQFLFADDNHVICILGDRISYDYRVEADTRFILEMKLIRE